MSRASRMVAEPLPGGRIALLSNADGFALYVLADEARVETFPLRNLRIQQFDAAIDGGGRIGIVAARNALAAAPSDTGTIDAAILDPAHPLRAEWSPLHHDVHVADEVRVVVTPAGFAAAWINEGRGRRIEAVAIDRRGHGGTVIDIGSSSPRATSPFLGLQSKDDELLFWWDDGEHLFQRRLPASLEGYALLNDLAQRFCGETKTRGE